MTEGVTAESPTPDESTPDESTGDESTGDAGPVSRRALALAVGAAVIIIVATAAFIVLYDDSDGPEVVIPAGTGDRIDDGEDPGLVASQIEVSVGDTLKVVNDDDRIHQIAGLTVLPGETKTYTFMTAGQFVTACTLHPNGSVTFVVT